jgi:integrase
VRASAQKVHERCIFDRADDLAACRDELQGHYQGVEKLWRVLRTAAGFPHLRLHDLRHSFASAGLAGGDTLPVIGALLGHADVKTTARYAHLAEDPVRLAANRISGAIAAAMASQVNTVAPLLSMRKPAA